MIITGFSEADVIHISSADRGLQHQHCLTELYSQGSLQKFISTPKPWCGSDRSTAKIKYSIFFSEVIFTEYLSEACTSKQFSTRISSLGRGFPLIYKTSEYIFALLAYCQETMVVLSFIQICICGKPTGAREWQILTLLCQQKSKCRTGCGQIKFHFQNTHLVYSFCCQLSSTRWC